MKYLKLFESVDEEDIRNILIDLFDEFSNLEFRLDIWNSGHLHIVSRMLVPNFIVNGQIIADFETRRKIKKKWIPNMYKI